MSGLWLGVVALAIAGGAALLWLERRERRQLAALAARLANLEAVWLAELQRPSAALLPDAPPATPPAAVLAFPAPGSAEAPLAPPVDALAPTADVLAGLTTHVQRLVATGRGAAAGLADQAILVIYQQLAGPVTPTAIAERLYVSLRTLERGLDLALDCTPSQLIVAVKMREAKRLLASGSRVAEVAMRVGFADPFHFSRRFKQFYGISPSALRAPATPAATRGAS